MTVSYKKFWKLYVSMEVLVKVCTALGVDFKDIMELVPDSTG
ncbi:DNA-binding Xre family transcriptional regulator [Anaerotaenia torta]